MEYYENLSVLSETQFNILHVLSNNNFEKLVGVNFFIFIFLVDVSTEVLVVNENVKGKGDVFQLHPVWSEKETENMKDSQLHQLLQVVVVVYQVWVIQY